MFGWHHQLGHEFEQALGETQVQSLVLENPLGRKWHVIPVFVFGKSHGQRNLVCYSPWSHKGSDMTEQLSTTVTTVI